MVFSSSKLFHWKGRTAQIYLTKSLVLDVKATDISLKVVFLVALLLVKPWPVVRAMILEKYISVNETVIYKEAHSILFLPIIL